MEEVCRLVNELARVEYGANRRAVARLAAIGAPAVPHLCRALKESDPVVRTWAAEALARIADPGAVASLCGALADADAAVRAWTARALVATGPAAVPQLQSLLADGRDEFRRRAAQVLGELRDARAVHPLCRLLRDHDHEVRRRAAEALGKIAEPHAVVPLCRALEDDDWGVRKRAALALDRIAQQAPVRELRAALPLLWRYRSTWSFETPDAKRVYRTAANRIDEATAWVRDLPVPGEPPQLTAESLPCPAGAAAPDPSDLPRPVRKANAASRLPPDRAIERHVPGPVAQSVRRLADIALAFSSVPFQ